MSGLANFFKIALRNLLKRKVYTAINLVGLGVGLAAVILIVLYAQHELTYDRFHEKADRIHLVYKERITPAGTQVTRDTWMPLADRMLMQYPGVENAVRLWEDDVWVDIGTDRYQETVTYADPSLFQVFDFPLVTGDPATALRGPNSAVISEAVAQKYFGQQDPIGKTIRLENSIDYTIVGVLATVPSNSTINPHIAVPVESVSWYDEVVDEWDGSWLYTFLLLREGADPDAIEAQFPALVRRIWDEEVASRTNMKLEPLPELYDAMEGNRRYAYVLGGIALLILLIASINFVNLATAQWMERAREVGVRKVLGAGRVQLARQFMGESTVLSTAALALALVVVAAILPFFNRLYGIELAFRPLHEPRLLLSLVLLGALIGLASGIYPAILASRSHPVVALRGGRSAGAHGMRRALVVTQFALAIALIAATLVVRHQITYMQSAELRFDRENVIVLRVSLDDFDDPESAATRLQTFRDAIQGRPETIAVSSATHAPGRWTNWFSFTRPEGWGGQDPLRMRVALIDAHYFDAYGMTMVEGRGFDADRQAESASTVVINEAAMKSFGWTTAVGKTIEQRGETLQIVGVVRDYHFESLRSEIEPVLHVYSRPSEGDFRFVAVRTRAGRIGDALNIIRSAWQQVDASRPVPYEFVDDTFEQLYERETRLATVSGAFTVLAILIACMGLFGLAAWSVSRRIKEVGVRKVLGASVPQIVLLLTRDFAKLVGFGIVVGLPLAYLAAESWLGEFAYRVDVGPASFFMAGAVAAVVACATVGVHAMRAALTDPVRTLRYE